MTVEDDNQQTEAMSLLDGVYECSHCERFGRYPFERPPRGGGGFYKFPATIGALDRVPLLLIGINPRRSPSNQRLCDEVMRSRRSFEILARNQEPFEAGTDGARYIRRYEPREVPRYGREPHYRQHLAVVEGVWGEGASFETYAAATELYLCSTEDTTDGNLTAASPCAARFFVRVIQQVRPTVLVTLGKAPREYLRRTWSADRRRITKETLSPYQADIDGHKVLVFDVPHVGDYVFKSVRDRAMAHAVAGIKRIVIERTEPEFVPLGVLFPPRRRGRGAASGTRSVDEAVVARAERLLESGRPFSDNKVYPVHDEARPNHRPGYRAYLAGWAIRQALGYDKSTVSIATKAVGDGYSFTITPK